MAITGLGAVAPNGVGAGAFIAALRAGRSGLIATPFEHPRVRTSAVGACVEFDATRVMSAADQKRLPRLSPMALAAAREAMEMASLGPFDRASSAEAAAAGAGTGAGPGTGAGAGAGAGAGTGAGQRTVSPPQRADGPSHGAGRPDVRASSCSLESPGGESSARGAAVAGGCDGLGRSCDARRVGLFLGTGGGGIDFTIEQFRDHHASSRQPSLWTITNATHGNLAGELSIRLGLHGPSHCVSTGCSSSSDALGTALLHLRSGRLDAAVVCGADAHLLPEALWTMELLGVISQGAWKDPTRASRPFDRDRDGFILGEGAWAVVLERAEHALDRGVAPMAWLAGYASTCDAYHRVRPDPQGAEGVRAIHEAIEDAGLAPERIDALHYHGTSTPLNDATETAIVRGAFGRHASSLIGTSVKSMIGHPQGACGAAAVVASVGAMVGLDGGEPFVPPTVNLDTPDPACDLDYTANTAKSHRTENLLVNCLAFGAKNAALVVRADRDR